MAALLFFPMVLAILILFIRNYQSTAEFNIVIEDQNGIYSDTITIELQQSWTKVIKLHNDYSLEVDYIYGLTPRLKSQLYFIGDDEKILLHSSNRKGTEFQPVKYEVSSLGNVRFVSPFTELDNG